jgi:atypical dual specificity phosphatase
MASDPKSFSTDSGAELDLWWAIPGVLAGMPMPYLHPGRRERAGAPLNAFRDDLPLLAKAGIGAVVNLLNIPGETAVYGAAGFAYHSMPIPDGFAPNIEQFVGFLRFMGEKRPLGRAVAVHCAAGLGRTGTVLAGYLISRGVRVEEAISRIRAARPGAIETSRQVHFLHELQEVVPSLPPF